MKEIDQRNDENTLLIKCNCGFHHFIEFTYFIDDDRWDPTDEKTFKQLDNKTKKKIWKHYEITFIEKADPGFWYNFKKCFRFLFSKKGELCYSGIGITSKDMKRIIKHFDRYMEL